ncbi:hypothetical protein D3Z53_20890 [Lachnospiraceae bacterium]|jgi:hypothetical protein|nr:hypothetical protein [uncultured Schaedlerella sp.]NBI60438.1 hypothetical protein [Lachnospiraceae bacterium]
MIRFAQYDDIPKIMEFICKNWKKDHIMGRDRTLFEFQHVWGEEVSFVISENEGDIKGILGYIPYGTSQKDVMLAIWKTIKTTDTMLGVKILKFLQNSCDIKSISGPGINPRTRHLYQFLGLETGCMKQWYRLRPLDEYTIALVKENEIPQYQCNVQVQIEEYTDFEELMESFRLEECLVRENHPVKTPDYLKRRYFHHPVYQYLKYGIRYETKKLLVILRIQEYNGASILRVIDGIGDQELLQFFTIQLDALMEQYGCEYADIYETGIEDGILSDGGWKLTANTGNIMPEYFSPFERRNIEIHYMSSIPEVVLFKGDGDMDRPN